MRLFSGVGQQMVPKIGTLSGGVVAITTTVGSLSSMSSGVDYQRSAGGRGIAAITTAVGSLTRVGPNMCHESRFLGRGIVAVGTAVHSKVVPAP